MGEFDMGRGELYETESGGSMKAGDVVEGLRQETSVFEQISLRGLLYIPLRAGIMNSSSYPSYLEMPLFE